MPQVTDAETAKAVVSALSAAIALVSAIAVFWISKRKEGREIFDMQVKYFEGFKKWAEVSADALTEAIHLCNLEPSKVEGESFFSRRHRLLIAISNQIDKGRWFFPNISEGDFGQDKEAGFRGFRHEVIDGLVHAYSALTKLDYRTKANNKSAQNELVTAKRHFVGCVQKILDPAGQEAEFRRVVKRRTS